MSQPSTIDRPLATDKPADPAAQFPATSMRPVEAYLRQFLAAKIQEAREIDQHYVDLLRQISKLVQRGGKRLRPQLVMKTYRAYGGRDRQSIVAVAASQELFHTFLLIHDDIIDRDGMRWGGPNVSGHYQHHFRRMMPLLQARHYANAWALIAGDACYNLSNEILLGSNFPAERLVQAARLVQDALFTTLGGELLDTALPIFTVRRHNISDEKILELYANKTAAYSFCAPLRLGALLAGADKNQGEQLDAFGRQLGVAFQLRDDILGIFGEEQQLGKPVASDLHEDKQTLLMKYALEGVNRVQRQRLHTIIGKPKIDAIDLQAVRDIMRATGALAKTEAMLEHYSLQARSTLLQADFPPALSSYLADLLNFCSNRDY